MIVVPILLFALAAVVIVVGGLATLKKLPGALVSLQASGLMWVIPAETTVVGIIAISYGANLGARTAVLYDQHVSAKKNADATGGCCSSSDADEKPKTPSVDMNALRRAARQADNQ